MNDYTKKYNWYLNGKTLSANTTNNINFLHSYVNTCHMVTFTNLDRNDYQMDVLLQLK